LTIILEVQPVDPHVANPADAFWQLYTRSYELFKKQAATPGQAQGRLTLWIAYRIGRTYYESGKFDMASRFFERIARTYRLEKWDAMLRPLLSTWYKCAQRLGDVELSVRLLLEMMSNGYGARPRLHFKIVSGAKRAARRSR
jgi:hypothetical protein